MQNQSRFPTRTTPKPIRTVLAVAAWLAAIMIGIASWENYASTPGADSQTLGNDALINQGWQLTLYVHPHCFCASASLDEFLRILELSTEHIEARVIFVCPEGVPSGWEKSELWHRVEALGNINRECDCSGENAHRVGAATSGLVVLSDHTGAVVFRGGITRARGRVGESLGRRAILALLAGEVPEVQSAPVYGCPLFDEFQTLVNSQNGAR
ncbi:hypothetical protein BH11PLA2_BH11PLA2_28660 [soil metagenome]